MNLLKLAITAYLAASSLLAVAQNKDWGNLQRYARANEELVADKNATVDVVFIGNSITDNWAAMRPQFFSENRFVGRGISGQTSSQFLVRFRRDVVELHPKTVVINTGTNDIAENTGPYDENTTFGNILSMVEIARANGINVVLTTVLPASGFGWNKAITDAPQKIAGLNKRLRKYAAENNIPFVDYFTPMAAADGISLNPDYTTDGVHPTDAGYVVMEQAVLSIIRK